MHQRCISHGVRLIVSYRTFIERPLGRFCTYVHFVALECPQRPRAGADRLLLDHHVHGTSEEER